MSGTHRAHVNTHPQKYGDYTYSWTCSCGANGGRRSSRAQVDAAARKHEKNPGR